MDETVDVDEWRQGAVEESAVAGDEDVISLDGADDGDGELPAFSYFFPAGEEARGYQLTPSTIRKVPKPGRPRRVNQAASKRRLVPAELHLQVHVAPSSVPPVRMARLLDLETARLRSRRPSTRLQRLSPLFPKLPFRRV